MSRIFYRVIECFPELLHFVDTDEVGSAAAEDAAEDFHVNNEGDGCYWPLTFALHASADGPEIGRYKIGRELVWAFGVTEDQ